LPNKVGSPDLVIRFFRSITRASPRLMPRSPSA
jgi:hypothetical protein